jgi:dynein heavy chain
VRRAFICGRCSAVYEFACMGIFEKHKLMFSLQMTMMILDGAAHAGASPVPCRHAVLVAGAGKLDRPALDFFIKGNVSLEGVAEKKPVEWLNEQGWKDLHRLSKLSEAYAPLVASLTEHPGVLAARVGGAQRRPSTAERVWRHR